MCGIFCVCSKSSENRDLLQSYELFKKNISNRGPDNLQETSYYSETGNYNILFAASVLWLQGPSITKQPLENEKSIFVYNGDVFGGNNISDEQRKLVGDTCLFLNQLESSSVLPDFLSNLHGPYAFVYLDKQQSKLYFGRDIYGRRSLLIGKSKTQLILTSVAKRRTDVPFMEVPSIGTFCLDLLTGKINILPWKTRNQNFQCKLEEIETFLKHCKIEGALINELVENKMYIEPKLDDLELITSLKGLSITDPFEILLKDQAWLKKVVHLEKLLTKAVEKRISTQPKLCKNCLKNSEKSCNHSLTGVLFSGGLDCAILALLADKFIEEDRPIDLINVSFSKKDSYDTPDKKTGSETLEELQQLRPCRKWRFVEVNVPEEELDTERQNIIADLIYPLKTILDDDLGCAIWFASRAKSENYTSPSRVLLVGMGADELFGGYTRHKKEFKKGNWKGLHQVLDEDWQNLSHRNLARDDRVVSDHGRQLRTPYLDEEVVKFVRNLNSWEKSYPVEGLEFGSKILLRSLAYYLGLKNAATFKKRALQFGSRIANSKQNGNEISLRLL